MGQGRWPEASLWRERLGHFLAACGASGPADQAARLREACDLFRHGVSLDKAALEAMIAAGAYDSAALALVGEAAGYMLSRSGIGVCRASVYLPGCTKEHTCEADTPALALLAATATALLQVAGMAAQRDAPRLN